VRIFWRTVFGKKNVNLSLKFGILSVGEIEEHFFPKRCVPATFYLSKFGEIDPRWNQNRLLNQNLHDRQYMLVIT